MRVRQLQSYLTKNGPIKETSLEALRGLRLGVDAVFWLRAIQSLKDPFCDATGGVPPTTVNVIESQLKKFAEYDIEPVFVIQGIEPRTNRLFQSSIDRWDTSWRHLASGEVELANEGFAKAASRVTSELVWLLLHHLKALGVSVIQAPYFATAQLATFAHEGVVDAIYSHPSAVLYGTPRVILYINNETDLFLWVEHAAILAAWSITHEQFLHACLMAGTEYCLTFPHLNLKELYGTDFTFIVAVNLIKQSSILNYLLFLPQEMMLKHVSAYSFCAALIRHSIVMHKNGSVGAVNLTDSYTWHCPEQDDSAAPGEENYSTSTAAAVATAASNSEKETETQSSQNVHGKSSSQVQLHSQDENGKPKDSTSDSDATTRVGYPATSIPPHGAEGPVGAEHQRHGGGGASRGLLASTDSLNPSAASVESESTANYQNGDFTTSTDITEMESDKATPPTAAPTSPSGSAPGAHLQLPVDFHKVCGFRLPSQIYFLMAQGCLSRKLPSVLVFGEWLEASFPIVDSTEYRSTLVDVVAYRARALGLVARHLNSAISQRPITFGQSTTQLIQDDNGTSTAVYAKEVPDCRPGIAWTFTDEQLEAEMKRQKTDRISLKFCLKWHSHSPPLTATSPAVQGIPRGVANSDSSSAAEERAKVLEKSCSVNSIIARTHLSLLETTNYIHHGGGMTDFGDSLSRVSSELQEDIFFGMELAKFGVLKGQHFLGPPDRPMSEVLQRLASPHHSPPDVASITMLSRVASLVPAQLHGDVLWESPLDYDLAAFHVIVRLLRKTVRQITEASLASALLEASPDLSIFEKLSQVDVFNPQAPLLPSFLYPRNCTGILMKFFLQFDPPESEHRASSTSPSSATAELLDSAAPQSPNSPTNVASSATVLPAVCTAPKRTTSGGADASAAAPTSSAESISSSSSTPTGGPQTSSPCDDSSQAAATPPPAAQPPVSSSDRSGSAVVLDAIKQDQHHHHHHHHQASSSSCSATGVAYRAALDAALRETHPACIDPMKDLLKAVKYWSELYAVLEPLSYASWDSPALWTHLTEAHAFLRRKVETTGLIFHSDWKDFFSAASASTSANSYNNKHPTATTTTTTTGDSAILTTHNQSPVHYDDITTHMPVSGGTPVGPNHLQSAGPVGSASSSSSASTGRNHHHPSSPPPPPSSVNGATGGGATSASGTLIGSTSSAASVSGGAVGGVRRGKQPKQQPPPPPPPPAALSGPVGGSPPPAGGGPAGSGAAGGGSKSLSNRNTPPPGGIGYSVAGVASADGGVEGFRGVAAGGGGGGGVRKMSGNGKGGGAMSSSSPRAGGSPRAAQESTNTHTVPSVGGGTGSVMSTTANPSQPHQQSHHVPSGGRYGNGKRGRGGGRM